MSASGMVIEAGEGPSVANPVGGHVTFKVRGEESGGAMTVFESVIAPGEGPPAHVHANEEETLYVLDGSFRFLLGDEIIEGAQGMMMFVPRGKPHGFQNIGSVPGRLLITFTPSGMERFFELTGSDRERFEQMAAQVGMQVVGPPLSARP